MYNHTPLSTIHTKKIYLSTHHFLRPINLIGYLVNLSRSLQVFPAYISPVIVSLCSMHLYNIFRYNQK